MDTNNKVDLLNRSLQIYASVIFDSTTISYSVDSEVTSNCEVKIIFDSKFDLQSRLSRRDFIYIGKLNIFGIILDFTIDSETSAKIIFQMGNDVLAHDTLLNTQTNIALGNMISTKLTSEFVTTTFVQSKLPINITNSSTKVGTVFSPDGVIEFSKLWRQLKRTNNIEITTDLKGGEITRSIDVSISDYIPATLIVAVDDRDVLESNVKFSGDQTTRFTLVDNLNNAFIFYLQKDGSITTNANSTNLVTSFLDKKKYYNEPLTQDKAFSEAQNEMTGKYENNIELKVTESRFNSLNLGDTVQFVLKNRNVVRTVVSAKKRKGENEFYITLGTSRRRFTDLLKKKGSV